MVEKIVGGIVVALLTFIGRTLWQNRRHLSLLRVLLVPWSRTRVSVAVLLRLHDEDHYVLFGSVTRPGAFGPPGGVVKYHDSARPTLERLGFEPESRSSDAMRLDLRGFLPAARVLGFARWLYRGVDREAATECLRRELLEELGEVGHDELAPLAREVGFTPVRRVIDGPMKVAGESYRQVRFFEVYDLVLDKPDATELRTALLTLAGDPTEPQVIGASRREITRGRAELNVVLPQSAFLTGDRRLREDIEPVR
ncbi:SMODS-associated NUDIX domain-containing protein [Streptomyces sp. NPDC001514]